MSNNIIEMQCPHCGRVVEVLPDTGGPILCSDCCTTLVRVAKILNKVPQSKIRLEGLINSPIFTGGRIQRYTGIHLVEPESLSDHTYETAIFCLMIHKDLTSLGYELDKGLLLEKALLHDLDECLMSDIPRTIKYSKEGLKTMLDEVAESYMKHLGTVTGVDFHEEWKTCKDSTPEGLVLKVVDLVLVARKAIRELDLKSNLEFYVVVDEVAQYMRELYTYCMEKIENGEDPYPVVVINYLIDLISESTKYAESVLEKIEKSGFNPNYVIRRKDVVS